MRIASLLAWTALIACAQPVLTPPPSPAPRINGAMVFGVRPGSPFLYTIAASGDRPMRFSARRLPRGLTLDPATGRIAGMLAHPGEFRVTLAAKNARGSAERTLRIVVGDRLALTPPMGWNSWYCWSESVSEEKMRATAKAMVEKGLVNHGWTYVNIDDCWQGLRGGPHRAIQGNERFPDMAALTAYVHSLGLKMGLYSTPWIGSYAGFIGGSAPAADGDYSAVALPREKRLQPFQLFGRWPNARKMGLQKVGEHWFVDADARQWAEWGIDFVKFDWKPNDVPTTERIKRALDASKRDIVLSLSNEAPFEQAADWARLTNMWRTTGDSQDNWAKVSQIGFSQDRWAPYAGPGRWIDPDMLQAGSVGVPNTFVRQLRPSRLTPDEQYTQMSLWSLLSAPLLISCDVESMDAFTLGLLTNDEVIDINQDPLGKAAMPVVRRGTQEVWAKALESGAKAVGLFNRGEREERVAVRWAGLGVRGPQTVRDLWRQKNLGVFPDGFEAAVPAHGVVLVKIAPEDK